MGEVSYHSNMVGSLITSGFEANKVTWHLRCSHNKELLLTLDTLPGKFIINGGTADKHHDVRS